ncbi:MAG TPA: molecular chaperone DnaJ, partial [Clostridiales bacterium]|nr:molecular chaperone DnaJ [Clostridiales bacterium]
EAGDLIIVFKVLPHKLFKRKEFDLYVDVPVSFATAALGGKVKVPTLDSPIDVDIPEGTQSGKVIMVRGKGIRSRLGNGNLYVNVVVEVPSKLSKAQKTALTAFDDGLDIKQSSKMNDYSKNVQSLYGVDPYKK